MLFRSGNIVATKKRVAAPINPTLLAIIDDMYARWTGQEVADHIAHWRAEQENQLRIEMLKNNIKSMEEELKERTAK